MNKLSAIWNLFRKGEAVANPGAWKDAQNYGFTLGGFLLGLVNLAAALGYKLPVDLSLDQANTIGLGLATVIGFVFNNITSTKAGLLPAKPAVPSPVPAEPAAAAEQPDVPPVRQAAPAPAKQPAGNAHIDDDTRKRAEEFIRNTYVG